MEQLTYFIITGTLILAFTVVFFSIKQWVSGIHEKFNMLFTKLEEQIKEISKMVSQDDMREIEKRLRACEDNQNSCGKCKKLMT